MVKEGKRALIDESEAFEAQAATEVHQQLQAALKELKIGLVHGRLKPKEKEAVMAKDHVPGLRTSIECGAELSRTVVLP